MRNAEHRKSVREICRAVQRIDIPAIVAAGIDCSPAFLAENIMPGNWLRIRSRINISELRSATVTRSASPLYSM